MNSTPSAWRAGTGLHPTLPIRQLAIQLRSDERRVIVRPFIVPNDRVNRILTAIAAMGDDVASSVYGWVEDTYFPRHHALAGVLIEHYDEAAAQVKWDRPLTGEKRLLAGAYLSMEYSVESAALFNPSIVAHPDQSGVETGGLRIIMSLRATGEGHISSIVFRTGIITPNDDVHLDPIPARLHRAKMLPERTYERKTFSRKLKEMGVSDGTSDSLIGTLPERFSLDQLRDAIAKHPVNDNSPVFRAMIWLAESNYHVDLPASARLDELAIFPLSREESNGMEDLRMTRFIEESGEITYYGTYTAYNGARTMPMLLSTPDFKHLEFHSLNGKCALNKGMALFPRRINGDFVMCGRIDGERLYIMRSKSVHFWESAELLAEPKFPWELMLIGNCGAPTETPRGWILLTHGVGPMRTYALGAMILDLEDPTKVIGHLRQPLILPSDGNREGYVPNIVYTCGSLLHGDDLFIPYALADKTTSLAVVNYDALIDQAIKDYRENGG